MTGQSRKLLQTTSTLFVLFNMKGKCDEISIIITKDNLYWFIMHNLLFDTRREATSPKYLM